MATPKTRVTASFIFLVCFVIAIQVLTYADTKSVYRVAEAAMEKTKGYVDRKKRDFVAYLSEDEAESEHRSNSKDTNPQQEGKGGTK